MSCCHTKTSIDMGICRRYRHEYLSTLSTYGSLFVEILRKHRLSFHADIIANSGLKKSDFIIEPLKENGVQIGVRNLRPPKKISNCENLVACVEWSLLNEKQSLRSQFGTFAYAYEVKCFNVLISQI